MAIANIEDLMQLYARRGIHDWSNAPSELRRRANKYLANRIAANEAEATVTLNTVYNGNNGDKLQFIPMPAFAASKIERCFFLPIQEAQTGGVRIYSFDLFLLVAGQDCLAFRFETAEAQGNHTYTHVQFCKALVRRTLQIEQLLQWIPDGYPAFPLSASNPLALFLTMTVTVHGYLDGLLVVLREILTAANRSNDFRAYAQELKTLLNCSV